MSKGWKIFWIILIVLVLIGIGYSVHLYYKWKDIWEKITFSKPIPTALDLQGLGLSDLLNLSLGKPIKNISAGLEMYITNDSDTEISFNNLRVTISYKGQIITQTSDTLYNTNYVLPAGGVEKVSDTININSNAAAEFLEEKILGGHPVVDYKVDLSVYGIPIGKIYPIEGSFTW